MRLDLNYGRDRYPLELPDHWDVTVIRKPSMPLEPDPAEAVRNALAQPVGASPLVQEARGLKSACILICDITRPVPNGLLLPEIVRQLLDAGMNPDGITVLVATGLHRPNEGAELEELVGDPWVLKTVRVVNHFARDDAAHVDLGRTPRGTPVKLDRRFVEADLKNRDRTGRTAFHGRLLRRAQGHCPGCSAPRHYYDLPQRPLHGASQGRQLHPRR